MKLKHALIVDDSPDCREILQHFLHKLGYICVEAKDGFHATTILKTFSPDLIVSDTNMPNMDGMELLNWVKKHSPDIPFILFYSGGDKKKMGQKARKMQVCKMLSKPYHFPKLAKAVQKARKKV